MPRCFGASQSVRARRMPQSLKCAPGGPHLLPVHDPLVAVALGAGREAGEVRSRAGLGEELAPDLLAVQHPGEVVLLLLLGAVGDDRRPDHPDGDRERAGAHDEVALLLGEDPGLAGSAAPAAVLRGPRDPGPAVRRERRLPVPALADVLGLVLGADAGAPERVARSVVRVPGLRVRLEEGARFGAEGLVGRGLVDWELVT